MTTPLLPFLDPHYTLPPTLLPRHVNDLCNHRLLSVDQVGPSSPGVINDAHGSHSARDGRVGGFARLQEEAAVAAGTRSRAGEAGGWRNGRGVSSGSKSWEFVSM
jgi:hypothetical protein